MNAQDSFISISDNIEVNLNIIKSILKDNQSLNYRKFESKAEHSLKFCSVSIKNLCDSQKLVENIIKPIMLSEVGHNIAPSRRIDFIFSKVILTEDNNIIKSINECIDKLTIGNTILFVEGCSNAIVVNTLNIKERAISEPDANKVSRGPKAGFTESIDTNVSLIQQIIHSSSLKIHYITLGKQTKTQICIAYMENIASHKIINELFNRLKQIDIDAILDSHYIESFIADEPLSIFSTTGFTDRPDIASAKLLEGRVLLICDGSPEAITLPYLFVENFQSNEDYYKNYAISSFYRVLRYFSFIITTLGPSIYLSMVTYHQELVPTNLLFSIIAARNSIPFPTIVELILMLLVFETLIEASKRLPPSIGPTVSIVGGLILGQAAISARLVSAPIIILTAISGTTSFLLPFTAGPIIFIRLFCLAFSSFLGFYGLVFAIMLILAYMLSIKSFGVPYTLGLTTFSRYDIQDTMLRLPWWYMKYRTKIVSAKNFVRSNTRKGMPTR